MENRFLSVGKCSQSDCGSQENGANSELEAGRTGKIRVTKVEGGESNKGESVLNNREKALNRGLEDLGSCWKDEECRARFYGSMKLDGRRMFR